MPRRGRARIGAKALGRFASARGAIAKRWNTVLENHQREPGTRDAVVQPDSRPAALADRSVPPHLFLRRVPWRTAMSRAATLAWSSPCDISDRVPRGAGCGFLQEFR